VLGVPVLMIDVKGDLPNLLLSFPSFQPELFVPWTEGFGIAEEAEVRARAAVLAAEREKQLASWQLTLPDVAGFAAHTHVRVLTPGSSAGEPLHMLSSLERRSVAWDSDVESAGGAGRAAPGGGAIGRAGRAAARLGRATAGAHRRAGGECVPVAEGAATAGSRPEHAAGLAHVCQLANGRVARRPRVAHPAREAPPTVIVSVAHLDDEERNLVLGVLLEEVLAHTRSLPGSRELRALVVFDEVYGLLPPHPANPPSKRPTVALMKQGRAFGVCVLVATQNPMDLDYRALSNAGFWAVGRLQTDADRARVVESLAHAEDAGCSPAQLGALLRRLAPRWFLVRDVHASTRLALLRPRWALSYLRGPMTQSELRRALGGLRGVTMAA
jgi:hypothetical protein